MHRTFFGPRPLGLIVRFRLDRMRIALSSVTRHNLTRSVLLRVNHSVSEFFRIPKKSLLLQVVNILLLLVKMFSSFLKVLLLLKNTESKIYQ